MGIAAVKARDPIVAARLQLWLDHTLENFEERILAVDQAIALEWGLGSAPVSRAPMDELLAATAKVHGMTW